MRKLVTITLAVLMMGLFAAVVFAAVEAGDDSSSTVGTTDTSGTTETSPTTDTTETTTTETTTTTEDRGIDISGPCDEAEHQNDPRCTGGQVDDRDDGDHGNSGPGSFDDDDDHSGSGHGGDDDSSGHGGGNSGHGGGDDH